MPPSEVLRVVTNPSTCSTAHFWKWYLSRSQRSCAPSTVRGNALDFVVPTFYESKALVEADAGDALDGVNGYVYANPVSV